VAFNPRYSVNGSCAADELIESLLNWGSGQPYPWSLCRAAARMSCVWAWIPRSR